MEKECAQVKITETDEGYLIDVKGKNLKDLFACCLQICKADSRADETCCAPGGKEG